MILGISSQNHDASLALIDGSNIVWAAHSERYSRIKNDSNLNSTILNECLTYGNIDSIVWFENPYKKSLRRLIAGQHPWWEFPSSELKKFDLEKIPLHYVDHHKSHAAAGYFTSDFQDASILVIDAIGEYTTTSIWSAQENDLKCVWSKKYPHSVGLFYSAFTDYLGLKPNEEEYILMGMAAYGNPVLVDQIKEEFFFDLSGPNFSLLQNLHRGCRWWSSPKNVNKFDIAASVQKIYEEYLENTVKWIRNQLPSKNLVLMGGCALNCVANSNILNKKIFDNIWIMPNPGDAGSSIGAVAAYTKRKLNWKNPYLGTNIDRSLDIKAVVKELKSGNIVAIANGRAEFGPRALGNRSLLCDPRGPDAKNRLNSVKNRQPFRPFAPAILEEYADEYFEMPTSKIPYMQYTVQCKRISDIPGVCHIDGSSRIQTVSSQDNETFRALLEEWYKETGCPLLMNTSLNIRGEPLVNSWKDAEKWEKINKIKVY